VEETDLRHALLPAAAQGKIWGHPNHFPLSGMDLQKDGHRQMPELAA
jgi:hypothetical protein